LGEWHPTINPQRLPSQFSPGIPPTALKKTPQWKRCTCRKSLYIYEGGRVTYKSAKTRSWEQAERAAQAERDLRDPIKLELRRIAEVEAEKLAEEEARIASEKALKAKRITVNAALDQWRAFHKGLARGTAKVYRTFTRKVKNWAKDAGIAYLADVTPTALDLWRGQWSLEATRKDDKMGPTAQWNFQSRLKGFFAWATKIHLIDEDPWITLDSIEPNDERTMPLTQQQFAQLLSATDLHDLDQRYKHGKVGNELRTLFLIMRWTGLHITDVLMLPRTSIQGNRIVLNTQKTAAKVNTILPDHVVVAIQDHLPPRDRVHPDYLFWSRKCTFVSSTGIYPSPTMTVSPWLLEATCFATRLPSNYSWQEWPSRT
jgi:site-specific recombinase XerD